MDIYLGLGSNQSDRRDNLAQALRKLAAHGIHLVRVSPVVESPAMLPDDAPADWNEPFLNVVAHCRTAAAPTELLDALKAIERELGRTDRGRWAPRPIDLDLLLYGRETIATDRLRVPHPGITERAFVLTPLAALEPLLTIPGAGTRTVLEHARLGKRHLPVWMGIVNLTPDSFSDGGELGDEAAVAARVAELAAAGAALIDLGAESTRPGATPLTADEEWARLEPALGNLVEHYASDVLRPRFSIDTYHVETARRALALGADVINDVSGLTTLAMIELAAKSSCDWIAMHNLGVPADRARTLPADQDPAAVVERWLEERLTEWQRAGLDLARIVFDPGIGFGKNALQSLRILRDVRRFHRFGLRVLVGHSRKSFMHHVAAAERSDRDLFTIGASLKLCDAGVDILRVHDVAAHTAAYRGWSHVEDAAGGEGPCPKT
jgi:2-amino-4-hydroxy-6-hydroxymethyldihydropteridine diphosphokinase/dihydropteroate synthase